MNVQLIRRVTPFVYAVAVLLAVFLASGRVVGAVAAIGGVVVGGIYATTRGERQR